MPPSNLEAADGSLPFPELPEKLGETHLVQLDVECADTASADRLKARGLSAYGLDVDSELEKQSSATKREELDIIVMEVFDFCSEKLPDYPGGGFVDVDKAESQITSQITNRKSSLQKKRGMIQFVSLCWCVWMGGWNDGTAGPLLPRFQEHYKIGYSLVSMIFVGSCFGFICGATLNIWLTDRLGFGKILVIGSLCQLCGYAIIIPAPPFPAMVSAYVIVGFGISLQNAQANGFVATLHDNMTLKLGLIQGSYGLGAFSSPFSSTHFAKLPGRQWSYHFILSAIFCVINIVILIYVFRFKRQDEVLLDAGEEQQSRNSAQSPEEGNKYRRIFSLKSVPLFALFALIYIGVEVTIGGWIVTFIIHERKGGTSSGYISSGFFGGLTLGRVCLMWLNKLVGEHRVIILYSVIAIGLELTVWFVPAIIENAVAVSLVGLVLGPMFPLLLSHMVHILPSSLVIECVGVVTGIGITGSAAFPLITGLLSSKYGIKSVQPLVISMMGVMVAVWVFVPKGSTLRDGKK